MDTSHLIPVGTVARAARNIGDRRLALPYIYAGEEVTVMGHPMVKFNDDPMKSHGYIIRNADGLQVVAQEADLTLEPVPPPKSVEERIREAFREGYSQGHSRGLTCGKLYGGDDQYRSAIHGATQGYIHELRGEDEYDY